MALLEVIDLNVFYGKACSLRNVSLSVEKGEVVGIIGLIFDGNDLRQLSPTEAIRTGIGYAPEARNLFPYMVVKENLLVGAYRAQESKEKNLRMVFELFPVLEKRQNQEAKTLSGGEQQMLSLGRALMTNPRLLLVDEPTIGLAPLVCSEIADVLLELKENRGITIVITEQNVNFALTLAEEIYLLETGHVKMKGKPEELKQESYIQETYFGS
jgi:branched-chain amino acid transport system ATP-binding protein